MLKYNKKIKKIKLQFLKNKSLSSCVKLDKKSFPHTFKNFKIVESKRDFDFLCCSFVYKVSLTYFKISFSLCLILTINWQKCWRFCHRSGKTMFHF